MANALLSRWDDVAYLAARHTILALRELYPEAKHDLARGRLAMVDLVLTLKEWERLQKLMVISSEDGDFYL